MTYDGTDRPVAPVALDTLPDGAHARLVTVSGGPGLRSRLAAMGLRTGVAIRVVHNGGRGPFVVAAGEARIVLGRGMARKVLVVPNGSGEA
ncbi:MAG: ferrous iron transport protein A [Planctomycetes bacterium]|nr:ferrous iron transport protein A [Planctomycetota bacterium]